MKNKSCFVVHPGMMHRGRFDVYPSSQQSKERMPKIAYFTPDTPDESIPTTMREPMQLPKTWLIT